MKKFFPARISGRTAAEYCLLLLCMIACNFALPKREPVAFCLYFAAIACRKNPFVLAGEYVIASFPAFSLWASISCAVQAAFFTLVAFVYRRLNRKLSGERAAYALLAQLPFVFLFPHEGYAIFSLPPIWQKAMIAAFFFLLSLLFDDGLHALLFRALKCRLASHSLLEIAVMYAFLGLGIYHALGLTCFYLFSIFACFSSVVFLKNPTCVPFSIVLSLPLCIAEKSLLPLAAFAVFSCVALFFLSYGKVASALSLFLCFLLFQYAEGLFSLPPLEIVLRLCACAVPAALLLLLPPKVEKAISQNLLFYKERSLPRAAINRNRRAIGEQLYEVSALFREIECAFSCAEEAASLAPKVKDELVSAVCSGCPNIRRCRKNGAIDSFDKLIAVGCSKGRVSLIDLPADVSAACSNSTGLLFVLNKKLADFKLRQEEQNREKEERNLLARQARGVSDILRDIALEQSEEIPFQGGENALSAALAEAGILSSEIFLYGDGDNLTVSLSAADSESGKKIALVASESLNFPLILSEKIPLSKDRSAYILRKKPNFDAAFGLASKTKDGADACGDTHSVTRISEKRFLAALSDGMGSGQNAHAVSDNTLSLLESFYKARMPSELILSTVNKLISYSAEESFSCIDLASVDLESGVADIVKIGSPVGFVLSEGELRILEGDSLPIGMLDAVHPSTMQVTLRENDFLVFMSDGITTAFGSSSELYEYLSNLRPLNPQSLAEELLAAALSRYGGKAEDDMTVLAVRLYKAA